MPTLQEYIAADGKRPFGDWFEAVEPGAAARIRRTIDKLERGLRPDVKSVGKGVIEARIDYGPGYRVYFGRDGDELVILLGGGDKSTQDRDITAAHSRWTDYKQRKKKLRTGKETRRLKWHP